MNEQPLVVQIGAVTPVLSVQKFADEIGESKEWVESRIRAGLIPVVKKNSPNEKTLINNALYWTMMLNQPY